MLVVLICLVVLVLLIYLVVLVVLICLVVLVVLIYLVVLVVLRGNLPETNEIVTDICSCHNFFFPFFCANTFDTSLLLIVCALK